MNIEEIIKQEEQAFEAKKNVEKEVLKNKSEIVLEFAKPIIDFLEIINANPNYKFASTAHPRKEDLRSLLGYFYELHKKEVLEKSVNSVIDLGAFHYSGSSWYIIFSITEDFKPFLVFNAGNRYARDAKEVDKFYSQEDAVRRLTAFFIENRKFL